MGQLYCFFFFCLIIVLIIAINSNTRLKRHEQIRAYLKSREMAVIRILPKISSQGNWSTNVYEVTYSTAENEIYKARCIFGTNSELFWTEAEFVHRESQGTGERSGQPRYDPVEITAESTTPNKEQLINGLTSGYMHERIWTVRQIGEIEDVDELVLYILMDMSLDDPEPEVREAAKESLEQLEAAESMPKQRG